MGAEKNTRRRRIVEEIDCDVWVLTERHDAIDLSATHEAVYADQRPNRRAGERWVTIWSKFLIRARPATIDSERTAAVVVTPPAGDLLVFGTVLPWHSDRGCAEIGVRVRNWSEHHVSSPSRAANGEHFRTLGRAPSSKGESS